MSPDSSAARGAGRRTLVLLAALFLLPLMLAFYAYYGSDWRPARRLSHGVLVTPARPLPPVLLTRLLPGAGAGAQIALPLRERWSLVYIGGGDCDTACRQALHVMRQTRLALANNMTRVVQVFLATSDCQACEALGREHPGLAVFGTADAGGVRLLHEFPPARAHALYLVDPLGNLVMSYDVREDPHGLLEDLEKLLMLSHIG